jgi:hypothetical protein
MSQAAKPEEQYLNIFGIPTMITVVPESTQPSEPPRASYPTLRGVGIGFGTGLLSAVAFFFIAGIFYAVTGLADFLLDSYVPVVVLVNLAIVLYYRRTRLPGLKRYVGGVVIGVTLELAMIYIGFLLLVVAIALGGP